MSTTAKTLTVGIPCYNSAAYMDHAISSILEGSNYADDIEVVIVDDGSTKDNTYEKALEWQERYPELVKAIHQENGGHGTAVLAALGAANGAYFKVCDSDDWYDGEALKALLTTLRGFLSFEMDVDLVITNYVYEHVEDEKQHVIDYKLALRRNKVLTWDKIGHFAVSQYMLMHALCYRTDLMRDGGVPMPPHTFYVDNIYAYVPLPRVKKLYYLDVDLYRYYIGRGDQSINETVMAGRIDQQLRITRIMIDAYHLDSQVHEPKLRSYMYNYLTIMMVICNVFSKLSEQEGAEANCNLLWEYLRSYDEQMYRKIRRNFLSVMTDLPTNLGSKTSIALYRVVSKVMKFN